MTGYEPDWSGTVKTIQDGGQVRRDLLLWNIGVHLSCHPIHLLAYFRSGDPKDLARSEMSGGQGWEATRTGIKFRRWEWRPMGDKEGSLHSVNGGCPSCFADDEQREAEQREAEHGLNSSEQHEARVKRTGSCKDRKVLHFVDVETVRWTEVGRFVKPAYTEDRIAAMSDFMRRRYEHTAKRDDELPGYQTVMNESAEVRDEWHASRQRRTAEWFALEDEGRALARQVWDAALALEVGKQIGVLF